MLERLRGSNEGGGGCVVRKAVEKVFLENIMGVAGCQVFEGRECGR